MQMSLGSMGVMTKALELPFQLFEIKIQISLQPLEISYYIDENRLIFLPAQFLAR